MYHSHGDGRPETPIARTATSLSIGSLASRAAREVQGLSLAHSPVKGQGDSSTLKN